MFRTCYLPNRNTRLNSLSKSNAKSGSGMGSVLLDGGLGGQSSYTSIDAYERATGRKLEGSGLDDKISAKLSKLNIDLTPKNPFKKKNITMHV